jgi:uracil-DNA glycosylase
LHGANRTGRPFTGDWAGDLLYATLSRQGLARGTYDENGNDDFELVDCRISNSVRCVPPENKPLPPEIATCRQFLIADMEAMPNVRCILTLGQIAHDSALKALALKKSAHPFGHGKRYELEKITLIASYHCSRYNTNTGVLTEKMFGDVVGAAKAAALGR